MTDVEIIWLLLGIGYGFGFILIAYFGITGVNEVIEFKNRQYREEQRKEKKDGSKNWPHI